MAIARVAGPHAASEVRIHPLRRSALTAPRLAAVPRRPSKKIAYDGFWVR